MLHERIDIKVKGSEEYAALYIYIQDRTEKLGIEKRPMIIVIPGGGYEYTSDREAEPMALTFAAMGYNTSVLRYSVAPAQFPVALKELANAVKTIRENAEKWNIDGDRIIVCGASAGGHLAASLACFWNRDFLSDIGPAEMIKPNGVLLNYPVITVGDFTHAGSAKNIIGNLTDAKEFGGDDIKEFLSLENQVSADNPPTFIWATFEDGSVPVENTLMFANALRKCGISMELHIFPHGGHGLGLANVVTNGPSGKEEQPEVAQWLGLAKAWLWTNFPLAVMY